MFPNLNWFQICNEMRVLVNKRKDCQMTVKRSHVKYLKWRTMKLRGDRLLLSHVSHVLVSVTMWQCGFTRSRHCLSLSSCLCQVMSSRPLSLQFTWRFPHFISGLIWVVTSVRLHTSGGLSSGSCCYFSGCLQV